MSSGNEHRESWNPSCNDLEDELYGKTALSYETGLSMRGGSDATRYFASFLNKDDGGIMPKTDAGKRSLRINLDQNVVSKVTLSLNGEFAQTIRNPGVTQNENNGLAIPSALGYAGASWLDLRKRPDGTYPRTPSTRTTRFRPPTCSRTTRTSIAA